MEMRGPITVCGVEELSFKFGVEQWWMTKATGLEMNKERIKRLIR